MFDKKSCLNNTHHYKLYRDMIYVDLSKKKDIVDIKSMISTSSSGYQSTKTNRFYTGLVANYLINNNEQNDLQVYYNVRKSIFNRVSKITKNIIAENKELKGIDDITVINNIKKIINDVPIEFLQVTDDELERRLRKILAVESISGLLSNLTDKQRQDFRNAVERRQFFK